MGIRESLNKNPSITTGITIGIIVVALGVIIWQMMPATTFVLNPKNYFTVDDGKTMFEDLAKKNPPFDYKGQQAVRCVVFKCGDSGTPFIGYLEQYTPDARAKMDAAVANPDKADIAEMDTLNTAGLLVKKPGGAKWVGRATAEGEKICDVKCPDGTNNNLQQVYPNQ